MLALLLSGNWLKLDFNSNFFMPYEALLSTAIKITQIEKKLLEQQQNFDLCLFVVFRSCLFLAFKFLF